jgi:type III restriction enzyme
MELKLENLPYQDAAIQIIIKVFEGTAKNTFDNACIDGIRANACWLIKEQIDGNMKAVADRNSINPKVASMHTSAQQKMKSMT